MLKAGYTFLFIYLLGLQPINDVLPGPVAWPLLRIHHAVNAGVVDAIRMVSPVRIV